MTVRNEARLERGGIAMGTADNIDHFSDILGLLMLQNGASAADPTSAQVQTVLDFSPCLAGLIMIGMPRWLGQRWPLPMSRWR